MNPHMEALNIAAAAVIFAWCSWCVLAPCVRDGIIGKLIFILGALAAVGVIFGPGESRTAEVTLNTVMAMMGARHVAMKYFWPRIVRRVRCAQCPENEGN